MKSVGTNSALTVIIKNLIFDACVKSAKVIIVVESIKRVPCDSIISSSHLPMDRKVERDSRLHKFISLSGRGIVKFQSK